MQAQAYNGGNANLPPATNEEEEDEEVSFDASGLGQRGFTSWCVGLWSQTARSLPSHPP